MTNQELQSLRNLGNEAEAAATEIERLSAELQEAVTALPQAVRAERERCAKLCDDEAAYRTSRELYPLPGDDPAIQGHKSVTARNLAVAIRTGD